MAIGSYVEDGHNFVSEIVESPKSLQPLCPDAFKDSNP